MDDRDWQVIYTLYQLKSITQTGKTLHISQPALTVRIRQIEEEFQTQLISRGIKGVVFTPAGEYLAEQSAQMLKKNRMIKETVSQLGDEVRGELRLGVGSFTLKYKLAKPIALFREKYPNVTFDIVNTRSYALNSLLHNQEIHLGFGCTLYGWQNEKYLLDIDPLVVISKEPIEFSELPRLPYVDYETDYTFLESINTWWYNTYKKPPKIGIRVAGLDNCKEMVLNGIGFSIVPKPLVREHDGLCQMPIFQENGDAVTREYWMLFQKETEDQLKHVKLFAELNIAFFKEKPIL